MKFKAFAKIWKKTMVRLPLWSTIPVYAARDLVMDNGFEWSAAIAFYGILSVFPLALGVISVATWFIDPQWAVQEASQILGAFMPRADTIHDILDKAVAARRQVGVVSLLLLLWAGTRVFSIVISALNVACDVDETYGFFQSLRVELYMLLSVGLLFLLGLLSSILAPVLEDIVAPLPNGRPLILAIIDNTLPALLLASGFFCLYKFVSRHRCNWQSCLIGAGAATALTLGARPLFHTYVSELVSYKQVYGWLAIGIVILVWAQILALITLYGGEIATHVQMMTFDGLSAQEVGRRHRIRSRRRIAYKSRRPVKAN